MIINFKTYCVRTQINNMTNNCYNQLIEFDTQKSPSISQLMQIPSQKQPDMQISKSSTKIGTTLSGSLNMRSLPITIKKSQQVITPKPEQLTNQYFNSVLNEPHNSNEPIISIFKAFDNESRKILEKYCILQFDNLSLFLLYQLGWELGLQELNNLCAEELINLNYEQLNYSKFDLMKCSFYTFRKILDQYNSSIKFLDIQGLKPADLKSTIDDYCMMNNIEQKEKQNLYNQYIYNKQNTLLKPIKKNQATRRSMVQSTKNKIQAATPLKTKNTLNLARTPILASDEFHEPDENFNDRAKQIEYSKKLSLSESVNIMKAIAEEQNAKESQLYQNMLSMRKQVENTKNQHFLQESFDKLEKILESMQKQLQSQDEKIKKIQKSASDIKAGATGTKKIDFVFSF